MQATTRGAGAAGAVDEEESELPWSSSNSNDIANAANTKVEDSKSTKDVDVDAVATASIVPQQSTATMKSTVTASGFNGRQGEPANANQLQYTDSISLTTRPASFAGAPAASRTVSSLNGRSLNHGSASNSNGSTADSRLQQYSYYDGSQSNGSGRYPQAQTDARASISGAPTAALPNTYNHEQSQQHAIQQQYRQSGSYTPSRNDRGEGTSAQAMATAASTSNSTTASMGRQRGESNSSSSSDSQPLSHLLPTSSRMHASRSRRSRSAERQRGGSSGSGEPSERRSPNTSAIYTSSRTDSLLPPATRTGSRESGHSKGSSTGSNGGSSRSLQSSSTSRSKQTQQCAKCGLAMTGQFVRALGTVFHLDCFRCQVNSRSAYAPCIAL